MATIYSVSLESQTSPYHREAVRLADDLRTGTTITDGVIRWTTNGQIPPQDCLDFAAYLGIEFDMEKTKQTHSVELENFLSEFRRNYRGPSAEEKAEARAAHGRGKTMVNMITGHRWRT